ncbi:hypothetical protein J4526_09695 [Desulfurococcaceae archaeon MEX13E-LK6-19]|nr:hypothetical protein J4526_09695 [Desulfurococcaceae archaeon MEX13E-LK6-19]
MPDSGIVKIYYCKIKEEQQVFSRHHISMFSICRVVGSKSLEEIKNVLPQEYYEQLVSNGEIEIFDDDIVSNIIPITVGEKGYLRLVLE